MFPFTVNSLRGMCGGLHLRPVLHVLQVQHRPPQCGIRHCGGSAARARCWGDRAGREVSAAVGRPPSIAKEAIQPSCGEDQVVFQTRQCVSCFEDCDRVVANRQPGKCNTLIKTIAIEVFNFPPDNV